MLDYIALRRRVDGVIKAWYNHFMKQAAYIHAFWMLFAIVVSVIAFYTLGSYLNTRIEYEELACHDRAYIIYKEYDDQTDDVKTSDWNLRTDACAVTSAGFRGLW